MEKTIVFNNAERLDVSIKIANIIRDRIIEGCNNFQCFSLDDSTDVEVIVNLKEVSFIY